jgi:hypothetical protein
MLQVGDILPIDKVLAAANKSVNKKFVINDQQFNRTVTMRVIMLQGTTCVCCGRSSAYFQVNEGNNSNSKTLRLIIPANDNFSETYMTKDHIIPKSLGGANDHNNYQPMCYICNSKKGPRLIDNSDILIKSGKQPTSKIVKHTKPAISTKRTISTKSHANRPTIGAEYEVMVYVGYIRWYTQVFHKNASVNNWNKSIRGIIRDECVKVHPNFNKASFNKAYEMLIQQLTTYCKGKPKSQRPKPATFFRHN